MFKGEILCDRDREMTFWQRLFETMEKTAGDIAAAYTRRIYAAPVTAIGTSG